MASRVVTQMISDLSGVEIEDESGGSVEFAYRGVQYSIDLTADEAASFDEAVATYVEHATRRVGARRVASGSGGRGSFGGDAKAIREWARGQGIQVPDRGRIPAGVRKEFEATR